MMTDTDYVMAVFCMALFAMLFVLVLAMGDYD